nr:GNAT family N-acetyltransferase [Sansalvadorimonas sp. 2012CJ34-2]
MHFSHAPNVFSIPEETENRAFWAEEVNSDSDVFYVAEVEGKIVGLITAHITRNSELCFIANHPVCRIDTVVVDHSCRGKGVGQMLMGAVEEWAKQQKASEIRLEVMEFNKSAQDFYAAGGYEIQSRIMAKTI